MDYYLKFESEDAANAALGAAKHTTDRGEYTTYSAVEGMALDIVGIIYQSTGETEMHGEMVVPVMAPLPGWHVNLRGDAFPQELEQYRVEPKNPRRVWAS